ncbi:MAG: DUF3604 domain-containing protein, partial [Myxococcales bacterium]|nr:DUF3604 domain-containing protein [Myxococcales bacterium]
GRPMGGDLPARSASTPAPNFFFWATRDPGTAAHPGTPLQRLQVVKGWVDPSTGQSAETIYEVAGDPNNGATVDPATCAQTGPGHDQLCTVWTDPNFDPAQRAFYYGRVIENPSCGHVAYDCQTLAAQADAGDAGDAGPLPAACADPTKTTLQERAWSSPIWYSPR